MDENEFAVRFLDGINENMVKEHDILTKMYLELREIKRLLKVQNNNLDMLDEEVNETKKQHDVLKEKIKHQAGIPKKYDEYIT